jgi:hypothetical protein
MTQFHTTAKPIQYYKESPLINKFALAVGDRCERLTQSERYQLATCISQYCWAFCELDDEEDAENLTEIYWSTIQAVVTGNVVACLWILRDEKPDTLSAILPAITEYAQNEYVDELEGDEDAHQMHEDELVLSALAPDLEESQA